MSLKNRRGCIKVSKELLEEAHIDFLKLFFSNFYPITIDNDRLFMNGIIKFYGYSEHFENSKEGFEPPEYIAEIHSDDKGKPKSIEFNKI